MSADVQVRGDASPEELAAVLAVVGHRIAPVRDDPLDALRRWRRLRQSVIRET